MVLSDILSTIADYIISYYSVLSSLSLVPKRARAIRGARIIEKYGKELLEDIEEAEKIEQAS